MLLDRTDFVEKHIEDVSELPVKNTQIITDLPEIKPKSINYQNVENLNDKTSLKNSTTQHRLSERSKERKVPSNRASRVISFGGLYYLSEYLYHN